MATPTTSPAIALLIAKHWDGYVRDAAAACTQMRFQDFRMSMLYHIVSSWEATTAQPLRLLVEGDPDFQFVDWLCKCYHVEAEPEPEPERSYYDYPELPDTEYYRYR